MISRYKAKEDILGTSTTIEAELDRIRAGAFAEVIHRVRHGEAALKLSLPGATFGGLFHRRSKHKLTAASGALCLDFDKTPEPEGVKAQLTQSMYCLAAWISPSGNGVKMLIPIPRVGSDSEYSDYYRAALEHYSAFNPDRATSDISRLCFTSWDPKLYHNPGAEVFKKRIDPSPTKKPSPGSRIIEQSNNFIRQDAVAHKIFRIYCHQGKFQRGSRNSDLFRMACWMNEAGVSESMIMEYANQLLDSDFGEREIITTVKSALQHSQFNSKPMSIWGR